MKNFPWSVVVQGALIFLFGLLGLGIVQQASQLIAYHEAQQTRRARLNQEIYRAERVYSTTRSHFNRVFDSRQTEALLKERYGLVHPQDLQIKWKQSP